ncbi:CDK5 regulatory subunit-associated protein 3-like [Halichondria panicea]|uniref:CDK5 regulatory subunit-associated protein 3-like n=1 Tax=Halichondria panicea TaxID=6063 RepID=UPI00312B95A1
MADEHLFPIDIHYNKLLDWLVDRRHCDSKWHGNSKLVRERITAAVKELPSSEQLAWVRDIESLSYFECVRVLECVKSVEGEAQTLFGQYTAPRVKEWYEIVKQFEGGNVHLAECAQRLTRMVNYEVPALKQQIARCKQVQRECTRKEADLLANSAVFQDKFSAACKDMGIAGKSVQEELSQLVAELPSVFDRVLDDLPPLISVITYYQSFVQYITSKSCDEDNFLPMLSYVLKHGNVTVYEWKHGNGPPETTTSMSAGSQSAAVIAESADIDWGDEIDFGEPEIDFGDSNEVDITCITLEDSGDVARALEEATNQNAEPMDAEELDSLLGSTGMRTLFINDILELREFLSQRLHELSHETTTMLGQFGSESNVLERQSKEGVAEMLGHVTKVLDHLTSQRIEHLFLIKGSQRYLERLCESLIHNLRLSNKAVGVARELVVRREGAETQALILEPKLKVVCERTKQLQAQIASDISRRYKNRVVNIMGEINQL